METLKNPNFLWVLITLFAGGCIILFMLWRKAHENFWDAKDDLRKTQRNYDKVDELYGLDNCLATIYQGICDFFFPTVEIDRLFLKGLTSNDPKEKKECYRKLINYHHFYVHVQTNPGYYWKVNGLEGPIFVEGGGAIESKSAYSTLVLLRVNPRTGALEMENTCGLDTRKCLLKKFKIEDVDRFVGFCYKRVIA